MSSPVPAMQDDAELVRADLAVLRAPTPVVAAELGTRISQFQALAELGEIAAHAEDPEGLLRVTVDLVARGVDADVVLMVDLQPPGHARVRAATRRELVGRTFPLEGTLTERALEGGALIASEAFTHLPGLHAEGAMCVPVAGAGQSIGALCALTHQSRPFDGSELQFLQIAGNVIGGWLGRHAALADMHEMQARLALADRIVASATVAAGLAHEINNPLAVVTSNLAWIADALDELPPGQERAAWRAEVDEALGDARRSADRIRDLVRDLRALNRVDEHDLSAVALAPLVSACSRIASAELAGRARLVLDLEGVPPVHGNEARLGQVFLNLLVNAAHAIPSGSPEANEVRVTARLDGEYVAVEVRDTGRGIAPEKLPRLFEPFFTSHEAAGPGRGRGLGLPICHQIVTSIGGSIDVTSRPGAGSTFRVLLRVAPGDAPPGHLARQPR